ncbi:MAG: alpha-L-rhamnosidase N-terminal domain-containing protein, partial [Chloroflexota bacterium]|nr:alpha-L-rhamnosidase N-terminal domain-containing protein [Chloroflexota bacterium]
MMDLAPARPRCEYLTTPLGIDSRRPRLSWVLESARRAQRQSAYQILVAVSEDSLRAGEGDLWDSGRVESGQSVHVDYAGPAPRFGQRCWWAVRVWDQDGVVSPYSEPSWWEMGLLDPTDWGEAAWISLDIVSDDPQGDRDLPGLVPSLYLRRTFTLTKPVRRARLYATARGLYEARFNGQRIGDALLTPGWTDYTTRIQYQTYDVTGLLRNGENALGAILGTG